MGKIGALFVLLCLACVQDVRTGKISNVLVLLVLTAGVCTSADENGIRGVWQCLAHVGLYGAVLYPLFCLGMLGAGDVKLLAVTEGFFAWRSGMVYLICVLAAAGALAVIKLLTEKNAAERLAYFCSYVRDVAATGHWKLYVEDYGEMHAKGGGMHMTLPLLAGLVIYMGGSL